MVHRREVDGKPIVLGNQGDLWGNAMTWFDHDTGSVWSQPLGRAILGPLKGTELELLPSTLTRWSDWREAHPDTFALDAHTATSGFDLDTMVIVVDLGQESVAFPVPTIRRTGIASAAVAGVDVSVVIDPESDNWRVFSRILDNDEVVELQLRGEVLTDVSGDRSWDSRTGLPLEDDGQRLDILAGFTSFAADYETFFPLGAYWQANGPLIPVN